MSSISLSLLASDATVWARFLEDRGIQSVVHYPVPFITSVRARKFADLRGMRPRSNTQSSVFRFPVIRRWTTRPFGNVVEANQCLPLERARRQSISLRYSTGIFLPAGLCLHRSLMEQAPAFCLWVICMDQVVEARLRDLALPTQTHPLHEIETEVLRAVKHDRTTRRVLLDNDTVCAEFVMSGRQAWSELLISTPICSFWPSVLLLEELERMRVG